ncbi:MAG: hypothetical protein CM15mP130_1690 [Verrucomicrobiota bacterium]|nr:MAG: hypothetical protein CM15mP130_1690 [Verrucomicrobiota bacterium]
MTRPGSVVRELVSTAGRNAHVGGWIGRELGQGSLRWKKLSGLA